jgi:hypothetical protein
MGVITRYGLRLCKRRDVQAIFIKLVADLLDDFLELRIRDCIIYPALRKPLLEQLGLESMGELHLEEKGRRGGCKKSSRLVDVVGPRKAGRQLNPDTAEPCLGR